MKIGSKFAQEVLTMSDDERKTMRLTLEITRVVAVVVTVAAASLALTFMWTWGCPALIVCSYLSFEAAVVQTNAINLLKDSRGSVQGAFQAVRACLSPDYAGERLFDSAPLSTLILYSVGME